MKVLHHEARPPVVGLCLLWWHSWIVSKYVEQNWSKFMDLSVLWLFSLSFFSNNYKLGLLFPLSIEFEKKLLIFPDIKNLRNPSCLLLMAQVVVPIDETPMWWLCNSMQGLLLQDCLVSEHQPLSGDSLYHCFGTDPWETSDYVSFFFLSNLHQK